MNDKAIAGALPVLADRAEYLIATAAQAPSVHNTQPWRFRVGPSAIELYCDPGRKLRVDPAGREMLVSCGAALFGLRLAIRSLGYRPVVQILPDPNRLRLLARVTADGAEPMTAMEREMLAVLHRHTHRGAFAPGPLPAGLVAGLQHDARAEGATLALVEPGPAYAQLAAIVSASGRRLDLDPRARAEVRRWSRTMGSPARDCIPAHAFQATTGRSSGRQAGRLRQRDFDQGRGLGRLDSDGIALAVTAVLLTTGDSRADWLRAGQALYRLLLHAATRWVFASLYTQPLEAAAIRTLIRDRLALPGAPQMLMQLGLAHTTHATARRAPGELITRPDGYGDP